MESRAGARAGATKEDWRAQVDKDLSGRSFEAALVRETPDGLRVLPLYTEGPEGVPAGRDLRGSPFRICIRLSEDEAPKAELEAGADAVWLGLTEASATAVAAALAPAPDSAHVTRGDRALPFFAFDVPSGPAEGTLAHLARCFDAEATRGSAFALYRDPVGDHARGRTTLTFLRQDLATVGALARDVAARYPGATTLLASTLPYSDAGADAADELAAALATGVLYLEALRSSGLGALEAARQIAFQVTVGTDTFSELCKLRALRTCWQKVVTASGVDEAPRALLHAVCAARTLTTRDPWVNLLRVTTEMFSAILGGADLVTPRAFDEAGGEDGAAKDGRAHSAHGRRVARNTGLVLREESFLGRVADPAGGSYYLETFSDALAREAWKRFRAVEKGGGILADLESGRLAARVRASHQARLARIAKRRAPILGVSEFANLDEILPRGPSSHTEPVGPNEPRPAAFPTRRDAEPFERLRVKAENQEPAPTALLVTLGPFAESRARVGFATGFFAAGGVRTRESAADEPASVVCLCGSDERYAAEAAARARALKALGCKRLLVAGRPGPLEASLRDAGVDDFVFLGSDVVAALDAVLGVES